MNKLSVKLTQPDEKIIATWSRRHRKIMIFHCEKKVADFDAEDYTALEVKLIDLQRFIGVNQLIGDAEMEMLKEFFAEELRDFSISEIEYSIKLAIAGHLDVKKLEHYQSFSPIYLQPIFVAYRNYRGTIMGQYHKAQDDLVEKMKEESKQPLSKEEQFLVNKKLCEVVFENYKQNNMALGLHRVFDILWDMNLIPYTKARMLQFEEMAVGELKTEARDTGHGKTTYRCVLHYLATKKTIDLNEQDPQKRKSTAFQDAIQGHNALVYKTKDIATKNVFAYLMESDTDISTYFTTSNLEPAAEQKNEQGQ